jgi:hypothetical protein
VLGYQLADHFAHFRGGVAADDLDVTNPSPAQSFLLYRVSSGGVGPDMVPLALELDGVERAVVAINDEQIDAFGIDGEVSIVVRTGEDFPETHLSHRAPAGSFLRQCIVETGEKAPLALIE